MIIGEHSNVLLGDVKWLNNQRFKDNAAPYFVKSFFFIVLLHLKLEFITLSCCQQISVKSTPPHPQLYAFEMAAISSKAD